MDLLTGSRISTFPERLPYRLHDVTYYVSQILIHSAVHLEETEKIKNFRFFCHKSSFTQQ